MYMITNMDWHDLYAGCFLIPKIALEGNISHLSRGLTTQESL